MQLDKFRSEIRLEVSGVFSTASCVLDQLHQATEQKYELSRLNYDFFNQVLAVAMQKAVAFNILDYIKLAKHRVVVSASVSAAAPAVSNDWGMMAQMIE